MRSLIKEISEEVVGKCGGYRRKRMEWEISLDLRGRLTCDCDEIIGESLVGWKRTEMGTR